MTTPAEESGGRRLMAAGTLAFCAVWLYRAWLVLTASPTAFVSRLPDDAFYYFQIARTVAAGGGPSFDGINATNGYHPLWLLVCAVIAQVAGADPGDGTSLLFPRLMLVLQLLLGAAAVVFATAAARRLTGSLRAAAVVPAAACLPWFIYGMTDGLESGLLLLWSAVVAYLFAEWEPLRSEPSARDVAFGSLLSMGFLARLDVAFFCAALGCVSVAVWARNGRWAVAKAAAWGVPVLIVAGFYLLLNSLHFDSLMPISGKLKMTFPKAHLHGGYLLRFPQATASCAVLACCAVGGKFFGIAGSARDLVCVSALFAALHFGFTLLFMEWGVHQWHFTTYLNFAAVAGALLVARLKRAWLVDALVAMCIMAGGIGQYLFLHDREARAFQARSWDAAEWAREVPSPGTLIGMSDCGVFGYARGGLVVNLDGVVNNMEYQTTLANGGLETYLRQQGIHYIAHHAVSAGQVKKGYRRYDYTVIGRVHDVRSGIALLERDEVYRSKPFDDGRGMKVFVVWRVPAGRGM